MTSESQGDDKYRVKKPLEKRLVLYISLGLLAFALLAGRVTYLWVYEAELQQADEFERQLMQTVRTQASVGAFAANEQIIGELLAGLQSNPMIQGVRVSSIEGFSMQKGDYREDVASLSRYPLYSPIDGKEIIGELGLSINRQTIEKKATRFAFSLTSLLILQTLVVATLLMLLIHRKMAQPLINLSHCMALATEGSGFRLTVPPSHEDDELGLLCQSANRFLEATDRALNQAKTLARTDPLTNLNNRRAFFEMASHVDQQSRRYKWSYSIIMLDIDHFKKINDVYGHDNGDKALVAVADIIRREVRGADASARLGGEEFVIILPEADLDKAGKLAERLRVQLGEVRVAVAADFLRFTASLGVAECCPGDDCSVDLIIKRADEALYRAKESGRNRVETWETGPVGLSSEGG
jgi:diguanylate cyclase (GGDEF)-like protein